jgi:uncharacterized repeat protein (TIGR01451 family)
MSAYSTGSEKVRRYRRVAQSSLCATILFATISQGVAHAQVAAGTVIPNSATLSFEVNGQQGSTVSNVAAVTIAEMLDVSIAAVSPRTAIVADADVTGVPFLVTNGGNGHEAFALAGETDQAGAVVKGFAIDRDGNGIYDPAVDTLLGDAVLPALAPGAQQRVFVLVAGAAAVTGDVTVRASVRAVTGSGAPGTVYAGQGDGGGDAEVGKTITYTLTAHFPGATAAVAVADPIPAGTVYRAGSLTIDGARLSDAADADAGSFEGGAVRVALGNVAAAGDHVITFQTTIQ